ncbi:Inorganic phosphate transporter 1-2 [Lachnellula suecica]|uniref:Inorganic phosphate transporter 1-2 n=1 Tax=Lachnellula suecica TaxID=602035 RepID=A0A8T9C255_9HELO|nr:Inorganic phosphate transporter 1-2 [Lachnellula suecica]
MADDGMHHHRHHNPTNYGIVSAPHGPETGDDHASFKEGISEQQQFELFKPIMYPDDSYTAEGTYWADLPFMKMLSFNRAVDNAETKKELGQIWAMMKKDPLSPVGWYFRNAVLPGAGLGLEGYVLFSIGNLAALFDVVWKSCWKSYTTCNETWVNAVTYLEIVGIIIGQILVGYLGDKIGRRWGLIQDAVIMFLGLIMLTASWGTTLNGWVICYALSLMFYGVGVGGEYPMTATAAMENATGSGKVSTKEDRLHRGRKVTMAFLMQGWGQFFNQAVLILLLLIFHHGSGNPPYSEISAQWTYRVSFALPAVGTLWLVYYRWYKMPLASKALDAAKKKASVTGYDVKSLKLTMNHFGGRLIATAGAWYCNDVFFYGNKLFQSQFISVISPTPKGQTASIMTGWLWNLVNVGVELVGYYLASFLIDNKFVGRKNMQQLGFLMCFICFVVPAFHYHYYAEETAHIGAFQALYFLSSFFNQFGPNSTTFLVAAEVFPTPVRASAHGFSAAVGKLGALTAAVLYAYITTQQKFYVVPWFGLAGMLVTLLFLPDTTGLDLKEQERRFSYLQQGREEDYHGVAVNPHHLSLWERLRGAGKHYNPQLDRDSKMADMAAEWEAKQFERSEKSRTEEGLSPDDDAFEDEYTPEMHAVLKSRANTGLKPAGPPSPSNSSGISNEKVAPLKA